MDLGPLSLAGRVTDGLPKFRRRLAEDLRPMVTSTRSQPFLSDVLLLWGAIKSLRVIALHKADDALGDTIPSIVHATSCPNDGGGG